MAMVLSPSDNQVFNPRIAEWALPFLKWQCDLDDENSITNLMHAMSFSEDRTLEVTIGNATRVTRLWDAPHPSAVVLAIHGGMAHSGDYETVGQYFRDAGITTVSFDLSGHGSHTRVDVAGFEVFLNDVEQMLGWTRAQFPSLPLFVVGHSMGALIATHLELSGRLDTFAVKGIVLSSPYFSNAIPVSPLVIQLSRLLATFFPTAKVPMESFTEWLTHDTAIVERYRADEKAKRRSTEASFRFGRALLDAQASLKENLNRWHHPLFAVVAGDDRLADAKTSLRMLQTVPAQCLELHHYPDNYHENFNELNRSEIFEAMTHWMRQHLS